MQIMAGARYGGAEAFFMRLVPALARAGIEQGVVIRRHDERARALRAAGLDPLELRFGGRLDFATGPRLARALAAFRPSVVLCWMNRAARFCRRGEYALVARLGGYYDLKYYRHCDHLIANTRDIRDYLIRQGWPANRATYLPNFVESVPAEAADRQQWATPEDVPLLLALGRLHANKGFDVLLEALTEIPEAWLWIAGDGPLRTKLRERAVQLGIAERIRFLGWRTDVPALLAAADLLVCPSRHEPLGNIVLEAWAHGRPVVAAAAQGPAALIRDGTNGLLVPVENSDALAVAIRRVLASQELAATLAAGGRSAYQAEFTEAKVVSRYRAFFETVARRCAE